MKIQLFILALVFFQCLCLKKTQNLKASMKGDVDYTTYAKNILNEINEYQHQQQVDSKIHWDKTLEKQAQEEAQSIKSKKDFGANARVEKLEQSEDNAFYTQFSVRIQTITELPNQRAFAIMVLEALIQEYQYNLLQRYNHAGIAVIPSSKSNEFLVVLQLTRKLKTYKSCKEAKEKGDTSDQIFIKRHGKKEVLTCDQVYQNGGWSLIHDSNRITKAEPVYIAIDDRDLKYTELLFRAKDGFHLSYHHLLKNHWEMDGLILEFFYFKFGNTWYSEAKCRKGPIYNNPKYYTYAKDITVIKQATKCFWGTSNQLARCAKEFILKKFPEGKLTQMSEIHTMEVKYIDCNYFDLFFQLYVR